MLDVQSDDRREAAHDMQLFVASDFASSAEDSQDRWWQCCALGLGQFELLCVFAFAAATCSIICCIRRCSAPPSDIDVSMMAHLPLAPALHVSCKLWADVARQRNASPEPARDVHVMAALPVALASPVACRPRANVARQRDASPEPVRKRALCVVENIVF